MKAKNVRGNSYKINISKYTCKVLDQCFHKKKNAPQDIWFIIDTGLVNVNIFRYKHLVQFPEGGGEQTPH